MRFPHDYKLEKGKARECIEAILAGDGPRPPVWHGIPCTLPEDAVFGINAAALGMKAEGHIDQAKLEKIQDAIGIPTKPPEA